MELFRIIVIIFIGAILMFGIQPLLFRQGLIWTPNVQDPRGALELWVSGDYTIAAFCVFGVSVICTFIWYFMASKSQAHRPDEISKWRLWWAIMGLIPLMSIVVAIGVLNTQAAARLSLTFFFVIDVLILFWLTTASSTPGLLMYTPPLAPQLRNFLSKLGVNE
ncbi:hypothetical protein [Crocosphaera sp.]|uniref:hypothetical protein n=1 Tax=Crocosphaera sp. TaxID=2729996 RepID=UPI0026199C95|nr:hypothetical protein [Crocosphaera sp.]MDJ0581747.1 hypothetical protein [Crocosphaera sp.]